MIRIFCILATHLYAQIVLDLHASDPDFPTSRYVMGKGIHRRMSDGTILHSTEWGPIVLGFNTTQVYSRLAPSGEEPGNGFVILQASDEGEIEIPSSVYTTPQLSIREHGLVGIGLGSHFLQTYRHFLIGPISRSSNQSRMGIELVPENPQNRCSGPIRYVDGIRSLPDGSLMTKQWNVNTFASIVENPERGIEPSGRIRVPYFDIMVTGFSIHARMEFLPWDTVILPMIQHVELRSSARRVGNSGADMSELRFENCDSLSVFPAILYSFYRNQQTHGFYTKEGEVILYPEDFVDIVRGSDGRSYCNVHITSSTRKTVGLIGSNILRSVVAHFDSLREMIGFCDPAE